MTSPTQAQIEMALDVFNHCMEKAQNRRQAITAVLTAATGALHRQADGTDEEWDAYILDAKEALTGAVVVAKKPRGDVWTGPLRDALVEDTIERCAQVAEQLFEMEYEQAYGQMVADAIRALKEK